MDELAGYLTQLDIDLDKTIVYFKKEISKYRCGKADGAIFADIKIFYYGNITPISKIAIISVPDFRTVTIKPYEKKFIKDICNAIIEKNIGLNPQDDGDIIKIYFPQITEERRKELVKIIKNESEKAKISIRNIRRDIIEKTKGFKKSGVSEDEIKRFEDNIQNIINKYIKNIDSITENKEKELMKL